jgi:hypothetical protein
MEKIKFIDVNGQQVVDLTPNYERPLALVDMDVLHRLTTLLPKADLYEIKRSLKEKISSANSVKDVVLTCAEFVAFNNSVNLIKEVFVEIKEQKNRDGIIESLQKNKKHDKPNETINNVEIDNVEIDNQ